MTPKDLTKSVIVEPLRSAMAKASHDDLLDVIIDTNRKFNGDAVALVISRISEGLKGSTDRYVFAKLKPDAIDLLVATDKSTQAIHHIWPDFKVGPEQIREEMKGK